jgi:guanylate kinase
MTQNLRSHGIMLILSSPSGAGKSSLAKALVQLDRNTKLSVSATTRPMRPGEMDGQDYHFIPREKFDGLIKQDSFLEYATVFDHHYGTLTSEVEKYIALGRDVVFDVDWQGAASLRKKKPENVVSIYILPPSLSELKTRLATRRQDDDETIAARMSQAEEEISHYPEYDYIVINDKFDEALLQVQSILSAERSKRTRLDLLSGVIQSL